MGKRWRKEEIAYLKRYARTRTPAELAERFRTDVASVRGKLKELDLAGGSPRPAAKKVAKAAAPARPAARTRPVVKPAPAATKAALRGDAKPAPRGAAKPAPAARRATGPVRVAAPAARTAPPQSPARPALPAVLLSEPPARPRVVPRPSPPPTPKAVNNDAAKLLPLFEQALQAMHRRDWGPAIAVFTRVVAAGEDEPELAGRARQYLSICREHQSENGRADEPEDPYLLAVFHRNRGDLAKALAIAQRGGRHRKDERLAYLAAAVHAARDESDEAATLLALAVELNPKNRAHALADPDFAGLLARGELASLLRRA